MKPAPFSYHAPKTVDEAVAKLAELARTTAAMLAGGQSLVPMMAFRMARPAHLIDINEVAGLDRLAVEGNMLSIGACVRHAAFHQPAVAGPTGALLCEGRRHIAHYPIRMRGTFCGSLAHADPASEWCLTAVTLGAEHRRAERARPTRHRRRRFFRRHHVDRAGRGRIAARGAAAAAARRRAASASTNSAAAPAIIAMAMALATYPSAGRRHRRAASSASAAPKAGRAASREAEAALDGQKPGDEVFRAAGGSGRRTPSIRWKTSRPTPNSGAIWCAP